MPVVLKEINQGVAIVTLNREDKMNSLNRELALSLQQVIAECKDDKSVRVIYITGKGKAFCAGQDLTEAADPSTIERILPEQLNPLVTLIRNLDKPVIAAVNGIAAGAGASVALCCDIVVAAKSAYFVQAFGKLGLIPDSGATYILPRLVGWQKATAFMMLGDKIFGKEAEESGMIYKAFDDETFIADSLGIANSPAQMSEDAISLTKQALNKSATNTFEEQLKTEEQLQQVAGRTEEFRMRLQAFNQKKKV